MIETQEPEKKPYSSDTAMSEACVLAAMKQKPSMPVMRIHGITTLNKPTRAAITFGPMRPNMEPVVMIDSR